MAEGPRVPTYHNYINGQWVESVSGRTYTITNPADTKTVLGTFQMSVVDDASRAIDAAHAALPAWSSMPAPQRASILYRAVEIMRERQDDIARAITLEEGKPLPDAQGEVRRAMNITEYAAGEGRRLFGYTTPSEIPNTVAYTTRQARWSGGNHHPLELSHSHTCLEDGARPYMRQHSDIQACFFNSSERREAGEGVRGCGVAPGGA